jgi:hypothetical protein
MTSPKKKSAPSPQQAREIEACAATIRMMADQLAKDFARFPPPVDLSVEPEDEHARPASSIAEN